MGEKHLFYDELGNEVEFIIMGKFTLDDTDYVAMIPADDIEAPTYILRVDIDDMGNEVLAGVDDDELKEAEEAYEELLADNLQ